MSRGLDGGDQGAEQPASPAAGAGVGDAPQEAPAGDGQGQGSQGVWAKPVQTLTATVEGAPNLVEGKRLVNPLQGFGKMWQKTYRVRLNGVETTPAEVIAAWRADFGSFWPKGNDFYPPLTGLDPG